MGCLRSKEALVVPADDDGLEVFLKYDFVTKLATGSASQVHQASCKESGKQVAIKCILREEAAIVGRSDPNHEVELMRKLEHENVIRLLERFEDRAVTYLVLEFCEGSQLFERLATEIFFEEAQACEICAQMASAMEHIHERGVVHRDPKPENWLFSDLADQGRIKLVNFSLAERCPEGEGEGLSQPCGTLHYVAPEVLRGSYGRPADVWTIGIVLFLMLYAAYPFDGETCQSVMQLILGFEPDWADSVFILSAHAQDLLKRLLAKDPCQRLSASQMRRHQWFHADQANCTFFSNSRRASELRSCKPSLRANSMPLTRLSKMGTLEMPLLKGGDRFLGVPPGALGGQKLKSRSSCCLTEDLVRSCRPAAAAGPCAAPDGGPPGIAAAGLAA